MTTRLLYPQFNNIDLEPVDGGARKVHLKQDLARLQTLDKNAFGEGVGGKLRLRRIAGECDHISGLAFCFLRPKTNAVGCILGLYVECDVAFLTSRLHIKFDLQEVVLVRSVLQMFEVEDRLKFPMRCRRIRRPEFTIIMIIIHPDWSTAGHLVSIRNAGRRYFQYRFRRGDC